MSPSIRRRPPPPPDGSGVLSVFAYGTLKQGFQNHAYFCRGLSEVLPADTWGRLHLWEPGIPILVVPEEKILLMGSQDVETDLEALEALLQGRKSKPTMRVSASRGWRRIQGELLVFPDAERRLRILDALEGFRPSPGERSYERVLLPVQVHATEYAKKHVRVAWAYVLPPAADAPGEALDVDAWEPGLA